MSEIKLINQDCIEAMKEMDDNSIDSIVTDPPYELGFMGKSWDSSGIAFNVAVWSEALRVLKPGGHLIAFSGSRTYHRMAVAIEDAGFEIRDQIMWVYGSGFPKSMNIGKALDKAAGAEREVVGETRKGAQSESTGRYGAWGDGITPTAPATPAAQQWEGWGTALKPAHEPMVLARKPVVGTVANNVLTYGVGGLNIEESRIASPDNDGKVWTRGGNGVNARSGSKDAQEIEQLNGETKIIEPNPAGRWPANFIHDGSDEVVGLFPDTGKSGVAVRRNGNQSKGMFPVAIAKGSADVGFNDSGSAARFFYCAKASKRDRNEGLDGFEDKARPTMGNGIGGQPDQQVANNKNHHPTVKPTSLMQYLVRLVTPQGGVVLDPFMGSGSTGKACAYEGFDFVGIDQSAEYVEIARARIDFALGDKDADI